MEKPPHSARSLTPVVSLSLVFALAVALRYPIADMPFERDEGEYAYIAHRWLAGELPYKDSFDQKPPGAFLAFAMFIRTLGPSPAAVHWGAQLYSLATLAVVFFLGRRLFGARAGAAAAGLCAFLTTDAYVVGNAANTETFMILPLAGGTLSAWRAVESGRAGWAVVAGLLGGAALLCKQVALFNVLFWLAWVLWQSPRRWTLAALLLAGLAAPLLLTVAYFWAAGAAREFYDCVIGYNLSYATRVPLADYPRELGHHLLTMCLPFWPVYLLATAGLVLPRRVGAAPGRSPVLFTGLWLLSTVFAASTGGQFFPHYFITTQPPLAVLAAAGLTGVTDNLATPARRVVVPGLVVAAVVGYGVLVSPWYYLSRDSAAKCLTIYGFNNPFAESPALAAVIAAHSRPEETVFVAGSEPQLYYYAGRKSASPYIFVYPLLTPFPAVRERQREVLDQLRRAPPAVIVTVPTPTSLRPFPDTPPEFLDGVDQLLNEEYEVVAVLPFDGKEKKNGELLTGREAAAYYQARPITFGSMPRDPLERSATAVVWRRRGAD